MTSERAAYAATEDVEAGFRTLSETEREQCAAMLREAAIIIDAYGKGAGDEAKRLVSCRMVRRQLGSEAEDSMQFPMGSTQGTMSAMGYSQSWTMGSGAVGELYLSKLDKKLLGAGNRIGAHSPLEGLRHDPGN